MAPTGFIRGGREVVGFWVVTLGLCLVAGLVSYELGRNWVGRTLGAAIASENVQIKPQEASGAANAVGEQTAPPPAQAKVEMEPRAPTEAEKADLTANGLSKPESAPGDAASAGTDPSGTGAAAAGTGTTPASGGGSYQVTAGSYTVLANAEATKRKLERRGYRPYLSDFERRGTTYHRVIVGDYGDQGEAERVKQELEGAGFVAGVTGG